MHVNPDAPEYLAYSYCVGKPLAILWGALVSDGYAVGCLVTCKIHMYRYVEYIRLDRTVGHGLASVGVS